MKVKLKFIFLSAVFIYLGSCSTNKSTEEVRIFPEYSILLDSIIAQPEGIVRGFELGDPKKNIEVYEGKKPDKTDKKSLFYVYNIDTVYSYTIDYSFEEDKLKEIEINITSRDKDLGTGVLNDLKNYFSKKYTAPLMDNGIYVFNCFDSQKKNFKINISDNSTSDCGKILILVFRED